MKDPIAVTNCITMGFFLFIQGYLYMVQERLGSLDTYKHVLTTEIYQDHPEYGVRDVANIVLSMLRQVGKQKCMCND